MCSKDTSGLVEATRRNKLFDQPMAVKVLDDEVVEGRFIPTWDLLQRMKVQHPNKQFWFVIGEDILPSLHRWKNAEHLLQHTNFLVLPRPSSSSDRTVCSPHCLWLQDLYAPAGPGNDACTSDISSTTVREALQGWWRGEVTKAKIAEMVPSVVMAYIHEHRLYDVPATKQQDM
eukprot:GHVS01020331.1.p2 GENE.GHVS01020331.1~~GHVS01020331.1.p2  ORF type:complete len:174 (+),score=34.61 GHVS01020331.1:435-956(+)